MQIHLHPDGRDQGPYSLGELNEAIHRGEIATGPAMAWYEGCASWIPLASVPGVRLGAGGSPPPPFPSARAQQGDATGGVIPYKNPHALTAYYLGIFGLIPIIGFFLAIPAFILGISGLKKRKRNPVIKGAIHAWIGIILGALSIGYHLLIVVAIMRS